MQNSIQLSAEGPHPVTITYTPVNYRTPSCMLGATPRGLIIAVVLAGGSSAPLLRSGEQNSGPALSQVSESSANLVTAWLPESATAVKLGSKQTARLRLSDTFWSSGRIHEITVPIEVSGAVEFRFEAGLDRKLWFGDFTTTGAFTPTWGVRTNGDKGTLRWDYFHEAATIPSGRLDLIVTAKDGGAQLTIGSPTIKRGALRRPEPLVSMGPTRGLPPEGQRWFVIGQDLDSVASYAAGAGCSFNGATTYLALHYPEEKGVWDSISGLRNIVDYGAGRMSALALHSKYPNAIMAIGVYLVDDLARVASGELDGRIDELNRFIRETGQTTFVRIGYEFDGEWNHYDPTLYRAAFRHIVTRCRNNPLFVSVWQGAAYAHNGPFEIADWYPGDDVVDWVAGSYFEYRDSSWNAGPTHSGGEPLGILAFARKHRKPVLIAESTPYGYNLTEGTYRHDAREKAVAMTVEEIWTRWYAPYFEFIEVNSDVIRAVAYINADWQGQAMWKNQPDTVYWGDSRVEANAVILSRWQTELRKPNWATPSASDIPKPQP